MFVAYNIFYNLYDRTKTPSADHTFGDGRRALATIELVENADSLLDSMRGRLEEYLEVIPVFREEYWPRKKVPISRTLRRAFKEGDGRLTVELLLKWLYKVRCNLVHGDKRYDDEAQAALLAQSSLLLGRLLDYFIDRYSSIYLN